MRKIVTLLVFGLAFPAYAQQKSPVQLGLESQIGALVVENISLNTRIQEMAKEIAALKGQTNAQQVPSPSPDNGSGGPQSGVR